MRVITRSAQAQEKTNASIYDDAGNFKRRIRVTRTIVFEGPEVWVNDTLNRSWVAPERPIELGIGGTVQELPRVVEEL